MLTSLSLFVPASLTLCLCLCLSLSLSLSLYIYIYIYIYKHTYKEILVRSLSREDPLRREGMTANSNILAWRIPWTGSHRVRHNWSNLACMHISIHMPWNYHFTQDSEHILSLQISSFMSLCNSLSHFFPLYSIPLPRQQIISFLSLQIIIPNC